MCPSTLGVHVSCLGFSCFELVAVIAAVVRQEPKKRQDRYYKYIAKSQTLLSKLVDSLFGGCECYMLKMIGMMLRMSAM